LKRTVVLGGLDEDEALRDAVGVGSLAASLMSWAKISWSTISACAACRRGVRCAVETVGVVGSALLPTLVGGGEADAQVRGLVAGEEQGRVWRVAHRQQACGIVKAVS